MVPFANELLDLRLKVGLGLEVSDAETLPLENREPLLYLVHPGTVDRGEMKDEARMPLQPFADLLAMVRRDVVADEVNRLDRLGDLRFEMLEKGDKFLLSLAPVTLPVNASSPRVEPGEQVQGALSTVLVFDPVGDTWLRWLRVVKAQTGLEGGLFVGADDDLVRSQRSRVEPDHLTHPRVEFSIPGVFGGQPHVVAPGLQLVVGEYATNRRR